MPASSTSLSSLVSSAVDGLLAALAGFDAADLSGAECVAVVERLAAAEKACGAARARAAARAASCAAHRSSGFRDAADWLASVSGSSAGEARAALDTAASLDACPRTRAAVVAGELSLAQAREITAAERVCPGSEGELVGVARRSTLAALRDEARRRRLAAVDSESLHARQRAARSFRHWRDDLGMVCGRFALVPEVGVALVHRLEVETDRIRRSARRAGSVEAREAHAADAFADLVAGRADGCRGGDPAAGSERDDRAGAAWRGGGIDGAGPVEQTGGVEQAGAVGAGAAAVAGGTAGGPRRRAGTRRASSADLVLVCDLRAWRRGHAHPDEPCHVVGGTPVPVRVARELAAGCDPFVKAVVHDGRRIDTVVHWGRHIPAEVRTALELGPPPDFDGAVCVEPGCGRRHGLEWDHVNPVANRGPTSYTNLAARCWPHHHDKTDRDRAAGLLGVGSGGARSGHGPP